MPWPSVFSKKTVSEKVKSPEVDSVEKAVVDPSSAPEVKKPCACASAPVRSEPVRCAPVACACACAPVTCLPLRLCCKRPQPLVLRSIPPAQNENQKPVTAESVPDVLPGQASSTEASSQVSQ